MSLALTDAELAREGERRYFQRRHEQRAALLKSGWSKAEVYAYVVRGAQPERERQAGEEQWERGAEEARRVQVQNRALILPRGISTPQAMRLIRRHYGAVVSRPRERRTARPVARRRTRRATARAPDGPLGDEPPGESEPLEPPQTGAV